MKSMKNLHNLCVIPAKKIEEEKGISFYSINFLNFIVFILQVKKHTKFLAAGKSFAKQCSTTAQLSIRLQQSNSSTLCCWKRGKNVNTHCCKTTTPPTHNIPTFPKQREVNWPKGQHCSSYPFFPCISKKALFATDLLTINLHLHRGATFQFTQAWTALRNLPYNSHLISFSFKSWYCPSTQNQNYQKIHLLYLCALCTSSEQATESKKFSPSLHNLGAQTKYLSFSFAPDL